jgi:hypothetical protein
MSGAISELRHSAEGKRRVYSGLAEEEKSAVFKRKDWLDIAGGDYEHNLLLVACGGGRRTC